MLVRPTGMKRGVFVNGCAMSVKGSSEERLVVVAHNPRKQRLIVLISIFLLLSVGQLFYYLGYQSAHNIQADARIERDQLQESLHKLEQVQEKLQRETAQAKVSSQIDRQANEQVRQLVVELEQQIADQKEEIAFYKGLMAPGEKEKGLSIRGLNLDRAINGDGQVHFRLIVQQLARVHRLVKGAVSINIIGMHNAKQKTFALRDLSQQFKDEKIKLRFKYFQAIDGDLVLPEGFEAQSVEVVAQSFGKKPARVERSFDWIVQET